MIKKKYIVTATILLLLAVTVWNLLLLPTYLNEDMITFQVDQGNTITDIAQNLKNEGLIRSVYAFKLYTKLNKHEHFQAGFYQLTSSMSTKEIAYKINTGDVFFPNQIIVTFQEGNTIQDMAETLAKKTKYSANEILTYWNNINFITEVIDKYDFITEEINNPAIEYPLNGYFFPDTYFLDSSSSSPEEVAHRMLQSMEKLLKRYSTSIDNSEFTIHEILTLASIIEYEAQLEKDRPIIAGVFINRLKNNMKLESCATLEMAIGTHKEIYNAEDMKVNSPYNTYRVHGLPIGPGNSPGASSIQAALNPTGHNYYFFLSDIYGDNKVYYAKTLTEHNQLKNKYLH